ncbi:hypothetical protein PISMIDRAFT_671922, partial [Pisolithus microcarpus 441]
MHEHGVTDYIMSMLRLNRFLQLQMPTGSWGQCTAKILASFVFRLIHPSILIAGRRIRVRIPHRFARSGRQMI